MAPARRRHLIRPFRECLHGLMYRACLSSPGSGRTVYKCETESGAAGITRQERVAKTCITLSRLRLNRKLSTACASRYQMRILGPNKTVWACSPTAGLKCQLLRFRSAKANWRLSSQSAAVSNTILDWAQQREWDSLLHCPGDSPISTLMSYWIFLARDGQNQCDPALS